MIYLLVCAEIRSAVQNHDGRAWFLSSEAVAVATLCQMNAMKSLANPTPVCLLVVICYTRFTTENFKQQKKSKKSRRNCKFALSTVRDTMPLGLVQQIQQRFKIQLCFLASEHMATRSLNSYHAPLRQIALRRLTAGVGFAAAA
jgi:hypothetical protein